ncbi:RNA polymerase II-associated protein 3 [Musca domestica]|uniref:RNA polymerase II-associated protein 3 n=1 Tax=Musca domestica TaxID=7370 RepID=A0A1I8MZH4_MUSDO|nr:RNA polymerase II-associated protein 3 [Musca domestica]
MEAARKSFEITNQVRQNAEEIKNAMNDLYSWEKEIKDKEKKMQSTAAPVENGDNKILNTMPQPRSHITEQASNKDAAQQQLNDLSSSKARQQSLESPTEKVDTTLDPMALKHKEANEIKDRGNSFVKLGQYDMAIEEYNKAIELFPNDAIYYCNRALCYLKLERYDECIDDCDRATDIDNLAVKAYYRRMLANESLGNNMDALKDCTTVLMIEPKNSEANRSLERINERLRKNAKNSKGPNFTSLRNNVVDILPIDKPAYKRSTKPLKRIAIADVVGPKESKNHENLQISDEDIDKIFNSNCGYFKEVKNPEERLKAKESAAKQVQPVVDNKENTKINENKENVAVKKTVTQDVKKEKANSKEADAVKKTVEAKEQDSNKIASVKKSGAAATTTNVVENIKHNRPLPESPKSTAQFYSNWKELSPQHKYEYLKSINPNHLGKILGAGFDSDTLTDVIRTLHDFYLPAKENVLAKTLLEVSKNNQVPILSLLMSNEERKALSEIVNFLKGDTASNEVAAQIMKNFNLN